MKNGMKLICIISFICVTFAHAQSNLTINGDIPWVVSEADYENMPIQRAIRDAERDWYKVFGYPPVVFHDKPASSWDGPVIIFGSEENTKHLIDGKVPEGKEQFRITTGQLKNNKAITAIGSDTRGTIYAIYTFSEKVLGIDPMYIFTDFVPEKKSEITLDDNFDIVSQKPTFEYRGWFINDEELHDGMHRDPLGGNVIAPEWLDKILETLLRCKCNMIIPESAPFPDATAYDLCKRRGVVITHHHVTPVGLNMMHWPHDVPFSFMTHKDILVDAWTKAVKAQADKEVVWVIGFRGESDGAFWNSDPAAPKTDEGRAKVIEEAMQTQTNIIRKYQPNATITAALWNEQSRFFNAGLLKVPEGVCKMFSDDGRGFMRDDGGIHLEKGDGLYYHVMMQMNTQNRTTEAVPPARFYSELKRYVEKGATKYAIINVSGIRPAVMSVEAISDFLWDAEPALSQSPKESMKDYLDRWYSKEFGKDIGPKLADLRIHYYDIPYMREKMPVQGRWRGARAEALLQYLAQGLLTNLDDAVDKGKTISEVHEDMKNERRRISIDQAKEPLPETEEFFPSLWSQTLRLAEDVPADRQDFYQLHFTFQVAIHMYSSKMLATIVDAYEAFEKDNDVQTLAPQLKIALDYQELIMDEAHKAEYGQWQTMFMHVRLMDIWRTRLMLKQLIAKIEGKPYTSTRRCYNGGSFWGDAHEYMDHGDGTFPYFYKHTGEGLDYIEKGLNVKNKGQKR